MLIKCPECELQASDKAMACPHCGYPFKTDAKTRTYRRSNGKRRRLPNGFGQISEIKNRNLRNPFRAMVTTGKAVNGRPICKPLKPESYFATYNDAYAALAEYNKNPYSLEPAIKVDELYKKWSDEYFKTLGYSSTKAFTSAWVYCSSLYGMRVMDLRARHIKGCIDEGFIVVKGEKQVASVHKKTKIKSLFNLMLDYALEYEIVDRNYARTFNLTDEVTKESKKVKKEHLPFTDEEIQLLWDNINMPYVDVILIQCYSGWRPQELGLLEMEGVDLENWFFTGGIKTENGIDRTVPIHSRIRPLVMQKYKEAEALGSNYLINCLEETVLKRDMKLSYGKYLKRFIKIRDKLNMNPLHRPHDARKHFVTAAKKSNVDEYAIKYIVGHAISDITEKVYTKRELTWLQSEVEKIK